jgi:CRISPR-associated protein Cas2
MFYLITFDISEDRVRRRVVKQLKGTGKRVQKSVFECRDLGEEKFLRLQDIIDSEIDHTTDTVRYYRLCKGCVKQIEWNGTGSAPETEAFAVV